MNAPAGTATGGQPPGLPRTLALLVLVAGAAGSIGYMIMAGRHQRSVGLMIMFAVWVLAPFVGLALADARWRRSALPVRATLYGLMLVVSLASLAIYGNFIAWPPRPTTAFVYIVIPGASWLLMAAALGIAVLATRGKA